MGLLFVDLNIYIDFLLYDGDINIIGVINVVYNLCGVTNIVRIISSFLFTPFTIVAARIPIYATDNTGRKENNNNNTSYQW